MYQLPVSRIPCIPLSRIPLSLVEGQTLRNAGLTRGWHRSRAHRRACRLAASRRGRLEVLVPHLSVLALATVLGHRWVGGAEWSPRSPRPSPCLRDEALVALRRGRGARRGGWRGCFQALLVELSACGGERHATQSATARGGKAVSGRHCKRNALSALQ
jgi:hypothetical protein